MAVELPNELIKCVQTPWGKLPGHTASEALVKISELMVPKLQLASLWWSPSLCKVALIIFRLSNLDTVSLPTCWGQLLQPVYGLLPWSQWQGTTWGDLSANTPKHHGFSAATWDMHIPSTEARLHPGCIRVWLTKPYRCLGGSSKDN